MNKNKTICFRKIWFTFEEKFIATFLLQLSSLKCEFHFKEKFEELFMLENLKHCFKINMENFLFI